MLDRRSFLRRTSLALTGGLIVGDAALEAFARLTHVRKSFPSAWPYGPPQPMTVYLKYIEPFPAAGETIEVTHVVAWDGLTPPATFAWHLAEDASWALAMRGAALRHLSVANGSRSLDQMRRMA